MASKSLQHHGINGQRWGQRNGPPYPLKPGDHSRSERNANWRESLNAKGSNQSGYTKRGESNNKHVLTDAERERRKAIAKKILIGTAITAGVAVAGYAAYKNLSIDEIKRVLSSGKFVTKQTAEAISNRAIEDVKDALNDPELSEVLVKSGAPLYRMESKSGFDPSKINTHTYMSFEKSDRDAYMAFLKDWSKTGERYEVDMKATSDIIAPTEKQARQIFDSMFKSNEQYKQKLFETLYKTYVNEFGMSERDAKKQIDAQLKNNPFMAGIYSLVRRGEDSDILLNEYKKRGYKAIIDYFDAGTMSRKPMILFDPSDTVVKTGEKKVTALMKYLAEARLKEDVTHPIWQSS